MQSDVVSGPIYGCDDQRISISHCQCWPWELAINCDSAVGSA